jgi:Ca2+-binding EF-hand superfamily protein
MNMSPHDFFRALGIDNPDDAPAVFREYFNLADTDGNHLLSYSEYSFFCDLLSTGEADFRMAFRLFDLTGDGLVSKDEFEAVLKSNSSQEFELANYAGLEEKFFGSDGQAKLSYETFVLFLREMKQSVLRAAFAQYDPEKTGRIPANVLPTILSSRGTGSHKAIALARYVAEEFETLTFDDFATFQSLVRDLNAVEKVLELYTATGGKMQRAKFATVLRKAAPNASEAEIDLILRLFGSVADSSVLDQESFITFAAAVDENNARVPMTLSQSMVLGGVSAMIGASCVFPIDKVKVRREKLLFLFYFIY